MISCTEFIPAYSELFKFLETKGGYDEVLRYWDYTADTYVETLLGPLADEKGILGCWEYWARALNEEAADFTMTMDPEKQELIIDMHHCPSKGLLLELDYMQPYHAYCKHCDILYDRVLHKRGIAQENDQSHCDEAKCCGRRYVMPEYMDKWKKYLE